MFYVVDQSGRQTFMQFAGSGIAQIDRAVDDVLKAFDQGPCPRMPTGERGAVLRRMGDEITARCGELARLQFRDNSQPLPAPCRILAILPGFSVSTTFSRSS